MLSPFERVTLLDRLALLYRTRPSVVAVCVKVGLVALGVGLWVATGVSLGAGPPATVAALALPYAGYRAVRVRGAADGLFLDTVAAEYPMLPHERYDTHLLHWTFIGVLGTVAGTGVIAGLLLRGTSPTATPVVGAGALTVAGLALTFHHFDRAVRVNCAVGGRRPGPVCWDVAARLPVLAGLVVGIGFVLGRGWLAWAFPVAVAGLAVGGVVVPLAYLALARVPVPAEPYRDGVAASLAARVVRSANPRGTPTWLPPREVHPVWIRGPRTAGVDGEPPRDEWPPEERSDHESDTGHGTAASDGSGRSERPDLPERTGWQDLPEPADRADERR